MGRKSNAIRAELSAEKPEAYSVADKSYLELQARIVAGPATVRDRRVSMPLTEPQAAALAVDLLGGLSIGFLSTPSEERGKLGVRLAKLVATFDRLAEPVPE